MPVRLDQLQPQVPAIVLAVDGQPEHVERLSAFGILPGQMLQILRQAPWHGPLHLQVGGTELLLRAAMAACVSVKRCEPT